MSEGRERFQLPPIEPQAAPWEPTSNPEDIIVPGLDTSAPVQDQIEQIDQLITIKLQVRTHLYFAHGFDDERPLRVEYRCTLCASTSNTFDKDTSSGAEVCSEY